MSRDQLLYVADMVSAGEAVLRYTERCVDSRVVVVGLEVSQLPLKIPCIPEQDMVEELSPHRPDHALDEGV